MAYINGYILAHSHSNEANIGTLAVGSYDTSINAAFTINYLVVKKLGTVRSRSGQLG